MQVYAARWLLPVTSPPVQDGAVAVEGSRIVAAGTRDRVLELAGGADVDDLGDAVVLPGLVNAHTHLELSWMAEDPPPGGDYLDWLRALLARREHEDPDVARQAALRAIETVVSRGTVAVGDVSNEAWIVPLLARSSLYGVAFQEIYGFRAADAEGLIQRAAERLDVLAADPDVAAASGRMSVALTPHGPHTTSAGLLRALAGRSTASRAPLSVHVAESSAEAALLADGGGPFAALLRARGQWDDDWIPPRLSPVAHLDRLGALTPRTLAVHCVQLEQQDHSRLQSRGATVVTCPRSNLRLGVGRAPIPQLLRQGIPVALGTDSLASAPDLDLFAEMAALRREHPGLAPAAVLRMATLNGARALGLGERLGSIEPGKLACLLVVPLANAADDPQECLCSEPGVVHLLERASGRELVP